MKNTLIIFLGVIVIVLSFSLNKAKKDLSSSQREYNKLMSVYQYCLEKEAGK